MDIAPEAKMGIIQRIRGFFRGLRKKKTTYTLSRFYHHIEHLDRNDCEYADAKRAVAVCDEAIGVVAQRVSLIEQLKDAERTLVELKCYENVTDEDAARLRELMSRLKGINRDRYELKTQIAGFDPSLAKMAALESEAQAAAPEMKEAEQRQRMFRHDINYLHGEKTELELEREALLRGSKIVQRFMTGVLVFFVMCVTVMSFAAVVRGYKITTPLGIMTILVIIVTALLYGFRRHMRYQLDMNLKKQKKAVGMLNKKNAVFAHYTNFLNFTYKKYMVRNADMLNRHLKEFDHYKHLTRRYDALRKSAEETEKEINAMLGMLKIPTMAISLEDFVRVFNLDEKRDVYRNAAERKVSMERTLKMLDERQARLWDELDGLNSRDGGVVDGIISQYVEEAGRIILNTPQDDMLPPAYDDGETEPA